MYYKKYNSYLVPTIDFRKNIRPVGVAMLPWFDCRVWDLVKIGLTAQFSLPVGAATRLARNATPNINRKAT